jgi:talin
VTLTGQGDNTDHNAVGAAVNTISTNLPDMAREVKMLAALMDDRGTEGDDLMGAARTLCGAFSDMLRAAEPQTNEVRNLLHYIFGWPCSFLKNFCLVIKYW